MAKFFRYLSPDEQRKRFLARIDDPDKNWKFDGNNLKERDFWPHYMKDYEACLGATRTKHAPWYGYPRTTRKTRA